MASSTEICNLALSHLRVSKEIANLETERSQEAASCRAFYETARDATLRDFAWAFASKIDSLPLVEEDPNDEWAYSYRYPTDCLKIRRILSGNRNDSHQTRQPYKVIQDSAGLLILTDKRDAELEYTIRADDSDRYPADFILAFSFRLAAYIAPRVTAGDPFKLGERALRMYQLEMSMAQASDVNEEQPDVLPESEFIRGRE